MLYTADRSTRAMGLALALGAALAIHGTMLWGFDGVAAQAAASCVPDNTATAVSRSATPKQSVPSATGTGTKSSASA